MIVCDCMVYPDPKFLIFKTKKRPHFFLRLEADFFWSYVITLDPVHTLQKHQKLRKKMFNWPPEEIHIFTFFFTKFEIFMLFVDLPHALTCNLELYLVKNVIPFLVPFKSLWENQPYGVDDYLNSTMVRSKEYFTCPHLWSSVKQKSSGCHLAVICQSSAFIWSSGCHLSVIWPSSSNSLFKTVWTVGIPT